MQGSRSVQTGFRVAALALRIFYAVNAAFLKATTFLPAGGKQ